MKTTFDIVYKVLVLLTLIFIAVQFVHLDDNMVTNHMNTNSVLEKIADTHDQLLQLNLREEECYFSK